MLDERLPQQNHVDRIAVRLRRARLARDPERGVVVIERQGVLAYGSEEADKTVAYRQRVEASVDGTLACHYEVEIVRALQWGPTPVSVAADIPTELATGRLCRRFTVGGE